MDKFTIDNTDGYTPSELDALNLEQIEFVENSELDECDAVKHFADIVAGR